jgi:hypothetical protein
LFSNYILNFANSDTSGPNSFPSNPFNLQQDYGRASFDYRNRFFMGGSVGLPAGFRISPFVIVSSGQPYSITLSQDLIGSSQFNQRPALAGASACPMPNTGSPIVCTASGMFNTLPAAEALRIPINSLVGPGRFTMNLRVTKTWGFGTRHEQTAGTTPAGGGGARGGPGGGRGGPGGFGFGGFGGPSPTNKRYNLTLGAYARNIFNYTNAATPSAPLTPPVGTANASAPPFFAIPNQLATGPYSTQGASRILYLQLAFSF